MPPAMEARGAAHANFYLAAVLFVMFDIEIVFLYPWAVSFTALGPAAFWAWRSSPRCRGFFSGRLFVSG